MKTHVDKIDEKMLTEAELKKYSQLTLAYGKKFENNHVR
jgi:hypothetical protein